VSVGCCCVPIDVYEDLTLPDLDRIAANSKVRITDASSRAQVICEPVSWTGEHRRVRRHGHLARYAGSANLRLDSTTDERDVLVRADISNGEDLTTPKHYSDATLPYDDGQRDSLLQFVGRTRGV
jgi:hypothetical protein